MPSPRPSALCGKSFESRQFPVTNARESGRILTVLGGPWNTYPVGPQYVIGRWRTLRDSANTPEGWEFESLRARAGQRLFPASGAGAVATLTTVGIGARHHRAELSSESMPATAERWTCSITSTYVPVGVWGRKRAIGDGFATLDASDHQRRIAGYEEAVGVPLFHTMA